MTILQAPNLLLIAALAALMITPFVDGIADVLAQAVFYMTITMWAYEELTRGVNWFRRVLGAVVLVYTFSVLVQALR